MAARQNEAINQQDGTGQPDPTQTTQGQAEKTFTQAQLDAIITERLTKERAKYAGFDDLKTQAEKWKEYEDSQKTELEKIQGQLKAAEEARQTAEGRHRETLLTLALQAEAAKAGIIDLSDVSQSDMKKLTIGEDGTISGADEAIADLAARKPHFFKGAEVPAKPGAPKIPPTNPGGSQTLTRDALEKMSPQEIQALDWEAVKATLKNPK